MTSLSDHVVGRPVSHRHGRAWQDAMHFLLGYDVPPLVSCTFPQVDASPRDYVFAYKRTPGARAVAVFVELLDTTAAGLECSVVATVVGVGTSYLPTGSGELRASPATVLNAQPGTFTDRRVHMDVIDVSGLTVGALNWIKVTWTDGPTTGTRGLARLHAFEVPRRDLAVDSSDAGVDGGWPFTGNPLYDGNGTTDLDGFKRFAAEIARSRNAVKRHLQACTSENIGSLAYPQAWVEPVSVGVWAAFKFNKSAQPGVWLRARRLYETTTANPYKFVCRYSTQSGTKGAQLRVTATSRITGSVATATLTLAPSLGFSASGEATLNVPCDGTDQDVRLTWDYQTDAGVDLYVSHIGIIEEES